METFIETIRAATAADATPEARSAGVQACRAILTALEATSGQPLAAPAIPASPIASMVGALRGVPPEQLLDIAIAKLRSALPTDAKVAPVRPLQFHLVQLPRRS